MGYKDPYIFFRRDSIWQLLYLNVVGYKVAERLKELAEMISQLYLNVVGYKIEDRIFNCNGHLSYI